MDIKIITESEHANHLALVGRLDEAGVNEVIAQFQAHTAGQERSCIVDISGVSFIGSTALRMFLTALKPLQAAGKLMVLTGPTPLVQESIEVSGLDGILSIVDELDEALKLIKNDDPPIAT